jgi:phosphonate transport system ATP-binding protein
VTALAIDQGGGPTGVQSGAHRTARADLAVDGLVKRFGAGAVVLDRAGFAVARGESVALIGPNGAGKSTFLRCCLRLIEPDEGRIALLGEDVRALAPGALRRLRSRVGFVFQRHNLVPRLSALSNVLHGALGRAGPAALFQETAPAPLRAEALECLGRVGLAGLAAQRADRLSGGQSQRVAIARALMQRPAAIFADEPVASLDPQAGEEVMELFVALARGHGLTFVYTTHNIRHALAYADRVVGLRGGRMAIDAPARELSQGALRAFYT